MTIRMVRANAAVKADADRVALQRGPLVYCIEGADNAGKAWNLLMPTQTALSSQFNPDLLGGMVTISGSVPAVQIRPDGLSVQTQQQTITAIPYFAWCNRGSDPMQVWLPVRIKDIRINF